MKIIKINWLFLFSVLLILTTSCTENISNTTDDSDHELNEEQSEQAFVQTLEKHLNAVSNKDLKALKSTMHPEGKMQLMLPGSEIINSVDSFISFHENWFQDTTWTFETKILNTEIGGYIGLAITEIIYREPERNGEPYFNRMIVSYGLERLEDKWYIISDHASSVEKSTDEK